MVSLSPLDKYRDALRIPSWRQDYGSWWGKFMRQVTKRINAGQAPPDSLPVTEEDMIELNSKMVRYASSDVLRLWTEFQALGRTNDLDQAMEGMLKLGRMLAQMRKEIGLEEGNPSSSRQLLGTFITDLHDTQYDHFFIGTAKKAK
jgi:hypothetical protein